MKVAWGNGRDWWAVEETFVPAPATLEGLNAFLRASRAELDSETGLEEVMELVNLLPDVRVTRTEQDLKHLTEDQPGPEVIRSGTIGERGQARWEPPRRDARELVFYANLWREGGADFVCLRVALATRTISVEVVDVGWFEIAAFLG
ncbi:hypothetical protein HMI50_19520 [Corallococcus carmarthensis]|uniref:Uncharacterized protein n=2 Tax=Corallococcus carmarthensis TaxID=2316728 RepID=A0A3A8JHH3_9BACT|nr:hypothetical protein [Corallococcus carmarthensis]RKG95159.1 hypothetical protein D7X32_39920 [Corallococcus carmarthensis]